MDQTDHSAFQKMLKCAGGVGGWMGEAQKLGQEMKLATIDTIRSGLHLNHEFKRHNQGRNQCRMLEPGTVWKPLQNKGASEACAEYSSLTARCVCCRPPLQNENRTYSCTNRHRIMVLSQTPKLPGNLAIFRNKETPTPMSQATTPGGEGGKKTAEDHSQTLRPNLYGITKIQIWNQTQRGNSFSPAENPANQSPNPPKAFPSLPGAGNLSLGHGLRCFLAGFTHPGVQRQVSHSRAMASKSEDRARSSTLWTFDLWGSGGRGFLPHSSHSPDLSTTPAEISAQKRSSTCE